MLPAGRSARRLAGRPYIFLIQWNPVKAIFPGLEGFADHDKAREKSSTKAPKSATTDDMMSLLRSMGAAPGSAGEASGHVSVAGDKDAEAASVFDELGLSDSSDLDSEVEQKRPAGQFFGNSAAGSAQVAKKAPTKKVARQVKTPQLRVGNASQREGLRSSSSAAGTAELFQPIQAATGALPASSLVQDLRLDGRTSRLRKTIESSLREGRAAADGVRWGIAPATSYVIGMSQREELKHLLPWLRQKEKDAQKVAKQLNTIGRKIEGSVNKVDLSSSLWRR